MRIQSVAAVILIAASSSALAKECRMPDRAPGARPELPPECRARLEGRPVKAEKPDSLSANQGFIDLGNGTQVRLGGRVRTEVMGRY